MTEAEIRARRAVSWIASDKGATYAFRIAGSRYDALGTTPSRPLQHESRPIEGEVAADARADN